MEFNFNVNDLFKNPITKITNSLVPPGFTAPDRRAYWECQSKVSEVINAIGEASANAQHLSKPITSAEKLRNSDHTVYILVDSTGNNNKGVVTGMLKVGPKGLYVFDPAGSSHQLKPVCVLDFYVHEALQRHGLGRRLFEHMLQKEDIEPVRLAIDRPSEKFLAFLAKHYDLRRIVPQMNNFVVFEGFFVPDEAESSNKTQNGQQNTPNNNRTTPTHGGIPVQQQKTNGVQYTPPFGRYGAPRPPCSMGQIIHNHSPTVGSTESSGEKPKIVSAATSSVNSPKLERPRSLSIKNEDLIATTDPTQNNEVNKTVNTDNVDETLVIKTVASNLGAEILNLNNETENSNIENDVEEDLNNKLSNLSTSPKSEIQNKTPSNLTDQGFLDLKFYHSKLW